MNKKLVMVLLLFFGSIYAGKSKDDLLGFGSSDDEDSIPLVALDGSIVQLAPPTAPSQKIRCRRILVRSQSRVRPRVNSLSDSEPDIDILRRVKEQGEQELTAEYPAAPCCSLASSPSSLSTSMNAEIGSDSTLDTQLDDRLNKMAEQIVALQKQTAELEDIQGINGFRLQNVEECQGIILRAVSSYLPTKNQFIGCAAILIGGGYLMCNTVLSDHYTNN